MTIENQATASERSTLFLQLRAAIRVDHAVLNKAIFGRFPECVPPKTDNAYLYTAGMSVLGQIYLAMEECWDQILQHACEEGSDLARHKEILNRLKTPLLERRHKLIHDLEYIETNILPAETAHSLAEMRNSGLVFKQCITDSIMSNPPVLLAYAWVMYLALFNGGRWMAEELVTAGSKFWLEEGDADIYSQDVLSFWFFEDHSPKDTRKHGESVKVDFCAHFDHAAELITESEQDLVVMESKKLFAMCVEMVEFMDGLELQTQQSAIREQTSEENISGIRSYIASISAPITRIWSAVAGATGQVSWSS